MDGDSATGARPSAAAAAPASGRDGTQGRLGAASSAATVTSPEHQQDQAPLATAPATAAGGPAAPKDAWQRLAASQQAVRGWSLGKVVQPREDIFNARDPHIKQDIIRMIAQYLGDEGYNASKLTVLDEANVKTFEREENQSEIKRMRKAILEGDWAEVDKLCSRPLVRNNKSFLYAAYKQQYLEYIEHHEIQKAFTHLNKRVKPLEHLQTTPSEFKDLCYLLTAKSVHDVPSFRNWEGITPAREKLAELFQSMVDYDNGERNGSVYVPPNRLLKMLRQAVAYQVESSRYHPSITPKIQSQVPLLQDYASLVLPNSVKSVFVGHTNNVKCVEFVGEDGMFIMSGSSGDVYSVKYHPTNAFLATGGYDKVVRLFDVERGMVAKTFSGHQLSISKAIFSPLGNLIISGSKDNTIKFWDIISGLCIKTISSHLGEVTCVEMSSDGTLLLSSSKDNSNRLWDIRMLRPIRKFKGHQNTSKNFIRASFAGDSLIDGAVYLWDRDKGDVLQRLRGHTGVVYSAAWNARQALFASCSEDSALCTWWYDQPIKLAQAAVTAFPAMNVLVYDGPGVSTLQRPLLAALRKLLGTRYDVIPVDAAAVRHSPWEDAAALLVMPGGRDLAFLDALQPGGIDKIARFVRGGGAYLGLCAGAYFACAAVAFEVGRTADGYEVIGDRPLRLCPAAVARGSVARGFVYGSERGAAAMPVTLGAPLLAHTGRAPTQQHTGARTIALPPALPLYVNGGPWFDLDGADPADAGATTVLATYAENGQPAIVECAPGRGRALLVGPHIEVSAEYVQSKLPHISDADECSHLAAVLERLSPSDSDRHALFATLLRRLGLQVDDPLAAVPSGAQSAATPAPTVTLDAHAEPRPSPITACFAGPEHRTRFVASFAGQQASATESVDLSDTDDSWHVWAGASNAVLAENAPTPVEDAAFRPDAGPEPKSKLVINAVTPDELASASSPSAPFSLDKYAQELAVRRAGSAQALFGMPVLYANVVTSTQTVLEKNMKLRASLPDGTVFVGSHQLRGRGRGRNSWISQNGCLQFSFKMSHREPASVVFIQYLFGLAVVEAIQSLPFCKTLPVCLKWPNDIYARTPEGLRKIGGILITSEFQSGAFSLIVGCGLNVSNPRPTVCLNELLALASVGAEHHLRHETVLAAILHTFGSLYALFMTDRPIPPSSFRFEIFLESFYRCWLHSNQQVQILEGGTKHDAVILGLDRSGLLRARLSADGSERLLQPDGNSFDMIKGLVFAKQ
ncbi:hypothetical protein HK105_205219 [Polyrhizophydium stewartii]|uniref:Uncharacterized protein n=1 Tax=Polyrhizophydium stewartii TaxID=2732419 RepID=A0ABR4N777_9FUNG